jgi:hypothetical protein
LREGDIGVSRYPPAEGERNVQRAPATNIAERRGDTGVSRYPPAEGERNVPSGEQQPPAAAAWYSAHEQATVVTQQHNIFPSPYIGRNSLVPREGVATSLTGTLYLAARLWESEHCDSQLIFRLLADRPPKLTTGFELLHLESGQLVDSSQLEIPTTELRQLNTLFEQQLPSLQSESPLTFSPNGSFQKIVGATLLRYFLSG